MRFAAYLGLSGDLLRRSLSSSYCRSQFGSAEKLRYIEGGPLEKVHDDIDATQSVCHRNGAGTYPFGGGKVSGDKHFFRQSILPY